MVTLVKSVIDVLDIDICLIFTHEAPYTRELLPGKACDHYYL